MQSTTDSEERVRASLEPSAYFFCSAFSESNQITVYPTTTVGVVSLFFVDPCAKLYFRQWHIASGQSYDRARGCWAWKNHRKVASRAGFVTAEVNHRGSFVRRTGVVN